MSLHEFVSGKTYLNKYANRLSQNGASFYVHYWGVIPKHYNNQLHKHSYFEVCYVIEGQGTYIDDNHSYIVQKNTMFFSRPGVLHQIKSKDGLFLLYVGFELVEPESTEKWIKMMKQAKQCSKVFIYVQDDTPAVLLWKSLLIQASRSDHPFFEELIRNLAYCLILSLLQTFVPYSQNDSQKTFANNPSPLLNQAMLYIKDNLSQPLKLTDVANYLHISSRHLSRLFVDELGITYSAFVRNERIQRAATLLKTTELTIKEIAEETGFSSVHYFTRVFTSRLGISPGRFRTIYTDAKTTTYTEH